MPRPTLSTVSRLYCVSRNRCAYPGCNNPLLDPITKVLIAEVCHIKADSPNGPRYDANQSDAERHGFANLIILCSNHHKVIDTDVQTWSVERLVQLKQQHEASGETLPDPPDDLLHALLATSTIGYVAGSIITTVNQSGGQVAHQIINEGEPRRLLTSTSLNALAERLRKLPSEKFFISAPVGHSEAHRLAEVLYSVLKRGGWTTDSDGPGQLFGASPPVQPGIHFLLDRESTSARVLAKWCAEENLRPTFFVGKLVPLYWPDTVNILVGPAPER
jgi:hypothetical protein